MHTTAVLYYFVVEFFYVFIIRLGFKVKHVTARPRDQRVFGSGCARVGYCS